MDSYEEYMKRAIMLAKKGTGSVHPNPLVGAVIVKDGKIISEDYHHKCGEFHAERNAIMKCKESMEGASIYVTLEPCCHYGKTPPCTDAIINAGISTVYIGSRDPNPKVAGNGVRILREHGIKVYEDILRHECDELNPVFFHYITHDTPYVAMKYAMTMDGKLATRTGKSQWITNEECRKHVHFLRHKYTAIMTGIGTVLKDNPTLNCRIQNGISPIRIICDTKLRIPLDSNICRTADKYKTIIAMGKMPDNKDECITDNNSDIDKADSININRSDYEKILKKRSQLIEMGIQILEVPLKDDHIDLNCLMRLLHDMQIDSILLEGGAKLNYSALQAGIIQHIYGYIGMKIFGGEASVTPVGGYGIDNVSESYKVVNSKITSFDGDFLIEGDVKSYVYRNN